MLGKLMGYEFKATARTFLPMFGALIVISLVNRVFDTLNLKAPQAISTAVSIILMVTIGVASLLITLQRFNKSLLQNEGYLTLTLPVKTESLILSKLFVSSVWYIASFVAVMISIMLLTITDLQWYDITLFFSRTFQFPTLAVEAIVITVEVIVAIILSMFASTLLMYACLALGMLVNSRRLLMSFGAFLVITTAIQILGSIAIAIIYIPGLWRAFAAWSPAAIIQLVLLATIVISLAFCAVFFLLTRHMLKNRLNLQ